jgi:hypothetical protein
MRLRMWFAHATALGILAVGAVIAVIVIVGPATTENTSSAGSAGRVSIPGSSSIYLEAHQYSFWYALLNQGGGAWPGVPPLSFNIDPPGQVAQPGFRQSFGDEDNVQEFSIERVAYVSPKVAGSYNISVSSSDGPGGVILIGKTLPNRPFDVIPGLIVFGVAVVLAGAIVLIGRRRVQAQS